MPWTSHEEQVYGCTSDEGNSADRMDGPIRACGISAPCHQPVRGQGSERITEAILHCGSIDFMHARRARRPRGTCRWTMTHERRVSEYVIPGHSTIVHRAVSSVVQMPIYLQIYVPNVGFLRPAGSVHVFLLK